MVSWCHGEINIRISGGRGSDCCKSFHMLMTYRSSPSVFDVEFCFAPPCSLPRMAFLSPFFSLIRSFGTVHRWMVLAPSSDEHLPSTETGQVAFHYFREWPSMFSSSFTCLIRQHPTNLPVLLTDKQHITILYKANRSISIQNIQFR